MSYDGVFYPEVIWLFVYSASTADRFGKSIVFTRWYVWPTAFQK